MKKLKNLSLTEHYAICIVSMILGAIIALISIQFTPEMNIGTMIGFILIITSFVWRFLFVKCPHCHCYFSCGLPFPPSAPIAGSASAKHP